MQIKEITNKLVWEDFLSGCLEKTFLQSWHWGEFQKTMGEQIQRLGFFADEQLLAVCLVIAVKSKRANFLLVPHGPVVKPSCSDNDKLEILTCLTNKLKESTMAQKNHFIRIVPVWRRNEENTRLFSNLNFKQAPIHIHPELSWLLDVKPKEEVLLGQMRKTTRYLIKQAYKDKTLRIIKSQDVNDIEKFNVLYQQTAKKHNFTPFSLRYLQNEFLAFSSDKQVVIFLAEHQGVFLASAVVIYWQGIGFYHQGASISSKIPAAYLLQWEAIREARARGCSVYNFWGIADVAQEKLKSHPWVGLSLFKQGFGGYAAPYVKTQDLPLSWRYFPVFLFELLRKYKRGF